MTRYYAVILKGQFASFLSFANADEAEEYDMSMMNDGYESHSFGEIGGDAYLVVYWKPKKAKATASDCATCAYHGAQGFCGFYKCSVNLGEEEFCTHYEEAEQ